MKKAIIPLVLAVVVLIVFLNVNKQPNAAGYVLSIGIGLGLGAIINNLIFKKSDDTPDASQATAESVADENS